MNIKFLGAAHEVTGSCTLLTVNGKNIIIDCGMEQGADIYENCDLPIAPSDIDCILLTHAHIDHSGKIPVLVSQGFKNKIYATYATVKLCNIMLQDSAHIQEFEAEWRNRKAKRSGEDLYIPMYTEADAEATMKLFEACEYDVVYDLFDGVQMRFIDAGHLLGSASISITATENGETNTIVFSGDIGNVSRPLIRDPNKPQYADYVVIESTYGNRLHGDRPDYVSQLTRVIQQTLDRGGNLVIPSFAVGRTQELLYLIREIKENKLIKGHEGFPVYVDSPLAVEATNIYSKDMESYYDLDTRDLIRRGINPITFPDLHLSITSDDSKLINADNVPKIILSASGMCEAGRIRHHLKHNLWRQESTVLFVGYQADGTLGRAIVNGATDITLFGEEIHIAAHIEQMQGISGHADMDMLIDWIKNIKNKPKQIFINHGNDNVCDEFAISVSAKLNLKATAPFNGAEYDLITGECIYKGNTDRIQKDSKQINKARKNSVFDRLLNAGKRLLSVIEKNRECSNKDIAKFADQVNAMSDKWDR